MAKQAVTRKNGAQQGSSSYDEQREIEKLAYQYFLERGLDHGYDQEDWLRAESIVKSRKS